MFTTCGKCHLYSRSLLRCVNGKVNPRTCKDTVSAMKFGGPGYICGLSKWKEKATELYVAWKKNVSPGS